MTQPAAPHAPAPSPAAEPASERRRLLPPVLLTLATIAALLPFINKPFHLDDPVYLWVADQIRERPLDFYGFEANWYGVNKPMHEMAKNPPLVGYYIALVDALFGRGERALHAAFLLPAVAVVLGAYFLARELGCGGQVAALAALLTLLTPVFLVSASTIMLDVMMLAPWVWAAWAWVRGIERNRPALLWVAAALITLSALTKYFGAALIPLLLVYGMMRRGRPGTWALPLLLPVALLAGYQELTRQLYGRGLLLDAGSFATATRAAAGLPLMQRLLTGLSFIGGGCLTAALAMLVMTATRARRVLAAALAGVLVVLLEWDPYVKHPIRQPDAGGINALYWVQLATFVTAGGGILLAAAAELRRRGRRDAGAVMLLLWLLGTLAFAAVLNWSVNGRAVLAAAPAAGVLAGWMIQRSRPAGGRAVALGLVLIFGAALSLSCVRADAAHARAARRAAAAVHQRYAAHPRPLFFLGHWGFQYYMERHGARALDPLAGEARRGDLIVQPLNGAYSIDIVPAGSNALPVVFHTGVPTLSYLATMDASVGAGFYSDVWGPLPYAFGRVPPDRYVVRQINGPVQPVPRR